MIEEVKDFYRQELFDHYNSCTNPFIIVTTKIDVTKIIEYCKIHRKFYATLGYFITKTVNEIENFKYRYDENGKIYYCDEIRSNYTQMHKNDDNIGYYDIPAISNFEEYIEEYKKIENEFFNGNNNLVDSNFDKIWLSCQPWFQFNSFVPIFNRELSIPQFIWDKYENVNGKYYVNLMICVHHGFVDGFHIGQFLSRLEKNIKETLV